MDYTELDKLEANIKRAIETIQKLQSENQRLKQENQNLLNRIRENERKIEQLRNLSQDNGAVADQAYIYKEKEGKIKQKIQQMLEKLETFQQLSISE
ncbi:MAG: cell division protein ZapB [bacterium]|nr:MAG: cell division protein ZapB [bacterium]